MKTIKTEKAALKAAVRKDGWALRLVPEALRTKAVCLAAVKQNGFAIIYVPAKLRDAVWAAARRRYEHD